ncbi:MAG: hypothetical protein U1E16_04465 [Hyphomicrobiales bacterium]
MSSLSKSHAMPGLLRLIAAPSDFCDRCIPVTETMPFGSQPFLEDAMAFALDTHFPELDAMKANYEKRARAPWRCGQRWNIRRRSRPAWPRAVCS